MNWVDKEISKHYKKENLCPFCNKELTFIFKGFPRKSDTNKLIQNNVKFILGGCCITGDESIDSHYFCEKCKKEFKSNLEEKKSPQNFI